MHELFLYNPRVPSITLTQDMGILDRRLNGILLMGSFQCMMNNERKVLNSILEFTSSTLCKTLGFLELEGSTL